MNYYPEFASLLNHYLQRADQRSAAWLARKLQLHPSTVAKWLNGDSRPRRPEVVIQVADILQVHDAEERQKLLQAAGYGYVAQEGQPATTSDPAVKPPGRKPATVKAEVQAKPGVPVAPWTHHFSLLVSLLGGLSLLYTLLRHHKRATKYGS